MSNRSASRLGRRAPHLSTILIYVQTILLLALTLFPVLWLVQMSLKVETEALRMPPQLLFAPTFEKAAAAHPDIVFGKIDTEAQQELAGSFQIRSIPTLMILRDQVLLFSQPGRCPRRRSRTSSGRCGRSTWRRCGPRSPSRRSRRSKPERTLRPRGAGQGWPAGGGLESGHRPVFHGDVRPA